MKSLFPIACGLLLASCSSIKPEPKPGTAAHQQWLHEQARENFLALKARQQPRRPAQTVVAATAPKPEKVRLKPFAVHQPLIILKKPFAVARPAPSVQRSTPANPLARLKRTRRNDDTIYYYDVSGGPEPTSHRYRAYKLQYARELAKRPEDLTSEEREWVRRHYRD